MGEGMTQEICTRLHDGLMANPPGFLAKNVVMMNVSPESKPITSLRRFDFNVQCATASGGEVFIPTVQEASVINGFLQVSYLPWNFNTGYHVVLEPDSGPDLMLTATLDGCAFGYVRADDGAVRVSHHNIEGLGGTSNAAQQRSLGFAQATFHKDDYYRKDEPSMEGGFYVKDESVGLVYGVRKKGVWRLYGQVVHTNVRTSLTVSNKVLTTVSVVSVQEI